MNKRENVVKDQHGLVISERGEDCDIMAFIFQVFAVVAFIGAIIAWICAWFPLTYSPNGPHCNATLLNMTGACVLIPPKYERGDPVGARLVNLIFGGIAGGALLFWLLMRLIRSSMCCMGRIEMCATKCTI